MQIRPPYFTHIPEALHSEGIGERLEYHFVVLEMYYERTHMVFLNLIFQACRMLEWQHNAETTRLTGT